MKYKNPFSTSIKSSTWVAEGLNLHKVLISELPQLHKVRLQAVHFLVNLHMSQSLPPQLLLQLLFAAVDLLHLRLQLLWIALNPGRRWKKIFSKYIKSDILALWIKSIHTCHSLHCCLMWGTCRCIPCCSVLEFHTPPQRSEWFHWKPLWLSVCSAAPGEEWKQMYFNF